MTNTRKTMNHGSLFSGIGGFDLAAAWMGWNNVFSCEKDEWCNKVLAKNFPNTERHLNIKDFNAKKYNGTIDIISGGFPCQPFSVAGQRKGKADDRYLWEEMLRIINEAKPAFVVGENVTGIIGMALDTVLSDLEAQDYTTETFIIPACSKNAWHRRDRVWIVAYANRIGWYNEQKESIKSISDEKRNNPTEEQGRMEQQQVGPLPDDHAQHQPGLFATTHAADRLLDHVAAKIKGTQKTAQILLAGGLPDDLASSGHVFDQPDHVL